MISHVDTLFAALSCTRTAHVSSAMQDVIDLREKQGWQARRKVEGPKRIEDIHKEARMEQQRARMAPPPDRRDRRDRLPDRPAMPMCASTFVFCPILFIMA